MQPLVWDSEFLGFPVARLAGRHLGLADLAVVMDAQRAAGTRLIYLMAEPADTETAAAARHAGARLLDRKVTFVQVIGPTENLNNAHPAAARVASTVIFTPQLEALAWQRGEYSRFRLDERFAPLVFPNLYSHWLRASLTGELTRVVLAAVAPAGEEVGLLTLHEEGGTASIGLLAVGATMRGRGVGQQLVDAARQQAAAWGCARLQVVTQRANAPACGLYTKCGFEAVWEQHVYHLWL